MRGGVWQSIISPGLAAGFRHADEHIAHMCFADHLQTLQRFRSVCADKADEVKRSCGGACAPLWATLLDTKGPEIRTAMLRGGKSILLEKGQPITVEAVGDRYTEFEGFKDESETRIGLSYSKLCASVSVGDRILLADGTVSIAVEEIVSGTELRGTCLNTKELGQRKNCNLPGVKVDLPVLTDKDVHDLQQFGCKHGVDFVAASFVQSAADVQFIRRMLDAGGGHDIKIISKIENQEGLNNFEEILKETDGIMVARGDLGVYRLPVDLNLACKHQIHFGVLGQCDRVRIRAKSGRSRYRLDAAHGAVSQARAYKFSRCPQRRQPTCPLPTCRHGDTSGKSAAGAENDDHALQPVHQVCDLRNADARVDDPEPAAHPRRDDRVRSHLVAWQ